MNRLHILTQLGSKVCVVILFLTLLGLPTPVNAQVAYAASVVSVTGPSAIKSGESGLFNITVKNTGSTPWQNSGANAVKLGTTQPNDRKSRFYSPQWLSENRAVSFTQATVAPQETATFVVPVTAGGAGGSVTEKFGLVAEGITWFTGVEINLTTNIQAGIYKGETLATPAPLNLKAGETAQVSLRVKNTGDVTWSTNASNAVKIATSAPFDRTSKFYNSSWISNNRVAVATANTIPGGEAIFNFTVQAPGAVGQYKEEFSLVSEWVTWLPVKFNIEMTVVPAIYTAQWVAQSHSRLALKPGEQANLWVDFRNTGNVTWRGEGANAVKLGTSRPLDRTSIIRDASWLSPNRLAMVAPVEVKPNEVGRFSFTITAGDKIGAYKEYVRPVMENVTWFPDSGVYFDISIDEELVITDAIRVGLTSTTDPITVSGGSFVVREGTSKNMVRTYKNSPVTVTAFNGGYNLSSGEKVNDWLRIIPHNGSILTVETSGIGSAYNTFEGIIEIRRSSLSSNVWVINELNMEDYLHGIAEVPESWHPEAQKAQMVAARTFAQTRRLSPKADIFHIYDDTRDQVYYGYDYGSTRPGLRAAADNTKGLVIKYQGQPINAYYHSDSGGATESVENVWGEGNPARGVPYLKGVTDPYTKPIDWSYTLTQDYVKSRFNDEIHVTADDTVMAINLLETFPSGRAKTVQFVMKSGRSYNMPFDDFDWYTDNNQIKSMKFTVAATGPTDSPDFVFTGSGWGHGIGMSQWSAKNMADAGKTFREILTFFYTGVDIQPL